MTGLTARSLSLLAVVGMLMVSVPRWYSAINPVRPMASLSWEADATADAEESNNCGFAAAPAVATFKAPLHGDVNQGCLIWPHTDHREQTRLRGPPFGRL